MAAKTKKQPKKSFFSRHWRLKHFLMGSVLLLLILVLLLGGIVGWDKWRTERRQDKLAPFYDTSGLSVEGPLGEVMRNEPLGVPVENGTAQRILYRTQKADGSLTFSSGMVFTPDNSNAGNPRPVVAWAHGTVGMGDRCAPSRVKDPTGNIQWINEMLAKGWVVTATDYAGLGTPGTQGYLVGNDEARDVLNSVRAARNLPAAQAGPRFAVWGHSQGGHSALFTASQANAYTPELQLVGTATAAPAAELTALLSQTSNTLNWVIGSEVLVSWPAAYPGLDVRAVTTDKGYGNYRKIAEECILPAVLQGQLRNKFDQEFFDTNIANVPAWRAVAETQTAPVLRPDQPVMVAESLTDTVVLPNTTALYIQRACQTGSRLSSLWLDDVSHPALAEVVSPEAIAWINDRFAGQPALSNCDQPLPVKPAAVPTP